MNRKGSALPHWKAATNSAMTPHKAMTAVNPAPRYLCKSEAVKITSNDMMESFAKAKVAM